jgi:hypothetical protein
MTDQELKKDFKNLTINTFFVMDKRDPSAENSP